MIAITYLAIYVLCSMIIINSLLPNQRALYRIWLSLSLGMLLMMWLPALPAFFITFSICSHLLALPILFVLTVTAWLLRDRSTPPVRWTAIDTRDAWLLAMLALPFTVLGAYLQWTHNIRPEGAALHVGQSTYGDLPLHLGLITSLRNVQFPADYNILPGVRLGYPFLADSFSTSFMLLGTSLQGALVIPGTLMMLLVFGGFLLMALRIADTKKAAVLAFLLLFLNGGLGFLYSFDMAGVSLGAMGENQLQQGVWLDRLRNILGGWYQTPVNHAEFTTYNLRWSNIIADMLIPQRTFLAGWVILLPCLYLLYDAVATETTHLRPFVLLGVMAGGLPLLHTHSMLALGLVSIAWMVRSLIGSKPIVPWLLYGGIAALLAAPQLLAFTFQQAGSNNFLRLQFNWVNNAGGNGLRDGYLWFYIKNIGLPFLLLICSLFEHNHKHRLIYSGAFAVLVVAELVLFQPNEYDNNKLLYVWYALCTVPIAEYALTLFDRLKGLKARALMGVLAAMLFFLSGTLSLARECVSDYRMFSSEDTAVADFAEQETPPHSVFLSWTQHINPISALAGRTIVCGPDLWLYYHGFDLTERKNDIRVFYQSPLEHADILSKYAVSYVLVGPHERSNLLIDHAELGDMLQQVYADEQGEYVIYKVPEG